MNRKELKVKEYELSLQAANNESQIVWQYFTPFILANTIIIGFISTNLQTSSVTNLILAMGGLIISIVWIGTSERRWGWYVFRIAQANNAEKGAGFNLTGDKTGKRFSEGKCVPIGEECYRLNWLARLFKTQTSTRIFIILFLFFYLIIIFLTQPFLAINLKKHYVEMKWDYGITNRVPASAIPRHRIY